MKTFLLGCALLLGLTAGSWTSTADAHWGRGGISIRVGRPYYGGGWGVGYGYAPRYYGGYYNSYPRYYGGYNTGYYGGGYYGGGYYGGCGW